MSKLIVPRYQTGFAQYAAESKAPNLWRGLIGAWSPFFGIIGSGNGGILPDSSGRNNPGTLTNMATPGTSSSGWWPSEMGMSLGFDGANDVIDVGTLGNFASEMATNKPSLVFWIKTTSTATGWLFGVRNAASNETRIDARINLNSAAGNVAGTFNVIMEADAVGQDLNGGVDIDTGVTDGQYHLVVVQFDGPNNIIRFFVDGISQPITYTFQTTPRVFTNFNKSLFIGGFNDGGAPLSPYTGTMAMALIYNRLLVDNEITQLYTNPYAMWELARLPIWKAPVVAPANIPMFKVDSGLVNAGLTSGGLIG